jgi:hypothetical protein
MKIPRSRLTAFALTSDKVRFDGCQKVWETRS